MLKTKKKIIFLCAMISGCATQSQLAVQPDDPIIPVSESPQSISLPQSQISVLDEVYEQIDAAVVAYREAISLVEGGSLETGENLIEDAIAGLDDAVSRCRGIEGCELDRALNAYQEMISLQYQVFAPGDAELSDEQLESAILSQAEAESEVDSQVHDTQQISSRINGSELTDLIVMNRYVENAIHDWLTWGRPSLMQSHENFEFLKVQMLPAYQEAGLPEALLFGIMAVESGGRVHAFSRAGAAGLLQFMRATGRRYGLSQKNGFDERLDPTKASEANVAYLNDQFRQLDFSLEKTLAAYNAGENRLKRLNRRLKGKDFWSSEFYYALPRDTRDYVPKVLAATLLYLHPERYKLSFPQYEISQTELVLERDASLSELTICLGNEGLDTGWFRTLRNLNPAVKPSDRLKAGDKVIVPTILAAEFEGQCNNDEIIATAQILFDASYAMESDLLPYVIQSGDTMGRIASRHRCMSLREIAAMNNISAPRYLLRAGKTIKVPNC